MQILIYYVQYLERNMMSIFSSCLKNVRVQALSDYVKFSRRLMQKIENFGPFELWFYNL